MKKRFLKLTALAIIAAMATFMLSGCMAHVADVTINGDGTASYVIKTGMEKPEEDDGSTMTVNGEEATDTFFIDDKEYIGKVLQEDNVSYQQLEDALNKALEESENPDNEGKKLATLALSEDGQFGIIIHKITNETKSSAPEPIAIDDVEVNSNIDFEISEETQQGIADFGQQIMESAIVELDFTMPTSITSVSPMSDAIDLKDNRISINLMKLKEDVTILTYVNDEMKESIGKEIDDIPKVEHRGKTIFPDVTENHWAYTAVDYLSDKGIVNGYEDGTFNPDGYLTKAQLCQILASYFGYKTGERDGYWAAEAIHSCIQNNLVDMPEGNAIVNGVYVGKVNALNFDEPATREYAIAAVAKHFYDQYTDPEDVYEHMNVLDKIPDYQSISPEFQNAIAIAYDIGLSNGTTNKGTFNPKAHLTRAQICQLIYNMDNVMDKSKNIAAE